MKKKALLLVLAALFTSSFLGCGGKTLINKSNDDDSSSTESAEEYTEEIKESADAIELSQDELDEFTDVFDTNEYNGFLVTAYNSTSEIAWDEVLYNGGGIQKDNVSKSERAAYMDAVGVDEIYTDLTAIEADDLKEYMETHAGVDYEDVKDSFIWTYVEKYDSYYFEHGDTNHMPYTCESGVKTGDLYVLEFTNDYSVNNDYFYYPDAELTLRKTDDGYQVISNVFLYEINNDPEQTFDFEPSWSDDNYKFITYQGDDSTGEYASMIVTQNGKYMSSLITNITIDDVNVYLTTIRSVGLFDFNADGITDIVVIANGDDGQEHMVLYEANWDSDYNRAYFYSLDSASSWLQGFVSGELNMPNVKAYLLGDNTTGEYSTWKEAYAQLIRIDNCNYYPNYSLIYFNDDDIPELVSCVSDYFVSIYTYKNGHVVPIIDEWSYGAGGNSGYAYSPKNSCLSNYNADYAGLEETETYNIFIDNVYDGYYSQTTRLYDDTNGNGYPDDSESTTEAIEAATQSTTYFSSYDISEDEISSKFNEITNNYDFVFLEGEYEYTTFIDVLENY